MQNRLLTSCLPIVAISFLAACSGGAGSGGYGGAASESSAPDVLVGTWEGSMKHSQEETGWSGSLTLNADGSCLFDIYANLSCTYWVTTDGTASPSPSAPWILMASGPDIDETLSIISVSPDQFVVDNEGKLRTFARVKP